MRSSGCWRGPITALPVCLIALPADWEPNGWLAALAISLMPLAVVGSRISDTDLIMKTLPDTCPRGIARGP